MNPPIPTDWSQRYVFKMKTLTGFYGNLVFYRGRIVHAHPILHFMQGWDSTQFMNYCLDRNWTWETYKP